MTRCIYVLAIGCLLLMPTTTLAQSIESNRSGAAIGERRSEPLLDQALRLSATLEGHGRRSRFHSTPLLRASDAEPSSARDQIQRREGKRTRRQRILGAIVGAAGGFFAGGYTGAWIEGDGCHCDDPGLKGFIIGAPVGAVVGGVLGERYLF